MSLCHKLRYYSPYISEIGWCKPLIFQTYITESKRLHSLKYHWVVKVKISGFQK